MSDTMFLDASNFNLLAHCEAVITEDDWHQCRPHTNGVIAPPTGNVYAKRDGRWWCITPGEMRCDPKWTRWAAPLSSYGDEACERVHAELLKRDTSMDERFAVRCAGDGFGPISGVQ